MSEPVQPPSGVSRRSLLRLGGAAAAGGKAPMAGPRIAKFTQALVVPPVAQSTGTTTKEIDGELRTVRDYAIVQRPATVQVLPATDLDGRRLAPTTIWGYDGIYPGPTFRQRHGEDITCVHHTNRLPGGRATSTHLHGSPTQPGHDGHPDDQTFPVGTSPTVSESWDDGRLNYGGTREYWYPNNEGTRTLWYHDHNMHTTAENAYNGLVGMFIQDPDPREVEEFRLADLPSGRYDVPLVIADKQ